MQPWVQEVISKYSSGISIGFLLHLNTSDYVEPGVTLTNYLAQILSDREIICVYNRAKGITFPLPSMREKFLRALGLYPQQDPMTGQMIPIDKIEIPKAPGSALPLLEQLLKIKKDDNKASVVILEYAESLVPAADIAMMIPEDRNVLITLESWAKDPDIISAGNPVFMITANLSDIHQSIRAASSKYESIRIPMPNLEARQAYVNKMYETQPWDMDAGAVARNTAGLSLINIEDIFLRAKQDGKLSWELIKERKRDIMKSEFGEVLEMMEPRYGFEAVGGLQNVKEFFQKSVVEPIKKGNYGRVPMGVLMTGPAGTGKTIMAEAVAKESGINMAVLNPAKIFSKWVGESERNLERALEAIKSLTPVLIFIDEIDQSVTRGESGDSGVSNRIFRRLLEFMSDTGHRGHAVFLAATNRPDLLDAALKRPGRFDEKIPFLVPNADSRRDIFRVMSKKYGLPDQQLKRQALEDWWVKVLNLTEGWTGAEIEKVTIKAVKLVQDRNMKSMDAVLEALKLVVARTQNIEFMTKIAIETCDDLEFVPEEYRHYLNDSEVKG